MIARLRQLRPTFWQIMFVLIMIGGAIATYQRIFYGLGGSTNLSDRFPWGIWVGFDVLCGVGLAAGGFTLVAVVHIFNIERYKPILRATILTAFLGYLLVCLALMFDLGRPDRIWHPLVMWNPHSVMFEVAWCVTLYTTVLSLEFAPVALERFGWKNAQRWVRAISVPLVILGVILSTLHQSSLGTLYLIVPGKLYPLWYTPALPALFFVSSVCVGLAMTIFESWHSARAFGRELEKPLLDSMARITSVLLAAYLVARFMDLRGRGVLDLLASPRTETYLFGLEILLLLAGTVLMFLKVVRQHTDALYAASLLVIFGFITNRLNIAITGMESASGTHYIPKWTEVMVTVMMIALGFAIFRFVASRFPIFEAHTPSYGEPEPAYVTSSVSELQPDKELAPASR